MSLCRLIVQLCRRIIKNADGVNERDHGKSHSSEQLSSSQHPLTDRQTDASLSARLISRRILQNLLVITTGAEVGDDDFAIIAKLSFKTLLFGSITPLLTTPSLVVSDPLLPPLLLPTGILPD